MYIKINHFNNSILLFNIEKEIYNICDIYKKNIIEITGKPSSGKSLLCEIYLQELSKQYRCCFISSDYINIINYQKKKIDIDTVVINQQLLKEENFKLFCEYLNYKYDILFFDSITYYKELFAKYYYLLYNTTIFYVTDIRFNLNYSRSLFKSTNLSQLLQKTNHRILCQKIHDFQDKIIFEFNDLLSYDSKKITYKLKKENINE